MNSLPSNHFRLIMRTLGYLIFLKPKVRAHAFATLSEAYQLYKGRSSLLMMTTYENIPRLDINIRRCELILVNSLPPLEQIERHYAELSKK